MGKSIKPKRWLFENNNIIDTLLARLTIKTGRHKLPISEMKERPSFKKVTEYYVKIYDHKFDHLKELD